MVDSPVQSTPRRRPRWVFWVMFLVYLLVLTEGTARLYWHVVRKVPLTSRSAIWRSFYPELALSGADEAVVSNTDDTYDVLILAIRW